MEELQTGVSEAEDAGGDPGSHEGHRAAARVLRGAPTERGWVLVGGGDTIGGSARGGRVRQELAPVHQIVVT